ncbi:hypothetical protein AAF712_016366 [Marasmius tenuissimus]|uniref:Uncharacterized protein n=1 Tax=Marasmius tenuissimus TaxID=585030 RepID=A0ABR2Z5W4_9AGAR
MSCWRETDGRDGKYTTEGRSKRNEGDDEQAGLRSVCAGKFTLRRMQSLCQVPPIGPGHNPRPSTSTSSASSLSSLSSASAGLAGAALIPPGIYGHYPPTQGHYPNATYGAVSYGADDPTNPNNPNALLLGPAPGSTIPNISSQPQDPSSSSAAANGYSGSFTFPPVFPPRDDRGYESDYDYATKYRVQAAELMRRGSLPASASSQPEWWSDSQLQGYYGGAGPGGGIGVFYRPGSSHGEESDSGTSASGPSSATSSSVHLPLVGEDHHQQYLLNGHGGHHSHHARHDSSASPPSGVLHPHQHPSHISPQHPSHISPPQHHAHAHPMPPPAGDGSRPNTSHGFSNAFGLMSLDDPNVLAGLASDGQPFFSAFEGLEGLSQADQERQQHRAEDPNVTPMPRFTNGSPHQGTTALPSVSVTASNPQQPPPPGSQRPSTSGGYPPPQSQPFPVTPREQETKELREFWKAYMRTPLTGGGPLGLSAQSPTATATTNGSSVSPPVGDIHMMSPGPSLIAGYRRQRVSSLPSVKTPTEEGVYYYGGSAGGWGASTNGAGGGGTGPKSNSNPNTGTNPLAPLHGHGYHSMHSIIQNNQANLANLQTPHIQQQPPAAPGATMTGSDDLRSYEAAVLARKAPTNLNLVPKMRRGNKSQSGKPVVGMPTNGTHVSFAPGTVDSATLTAVGATSPSKRRPSFKRLPSQTLESGVEKRQRWRDSDDDEDDGGDGDESGEGSGDEGSAESGSTGSGGSGLPAASSGGVRLVALDATTGSVSAASSASPPGVGTVPMMTAGAA